MSRSSYNYHRRKTQTPDAQREALKARIVDIQKESREAAGSRTIKARLQQEGECIGRYKVRSLMKEAHIASKQPSRKHRYKTAVLWLNDPVQPSE